MELIFLVEGSFNKITKEEINSEITQKLKDFGIKDSQIKQVLKKHDDDYIWANIVVIEEQLNKGKEIRNIPAYLMKAFEVDFRPTEPKIIAKQKLLRAEEGKEKLKLAVLKANYTQERNAKLKAVISKFSKEKLSDLREEFEQQILETNFHSDIYKSK